MKRSFVLILAWSLIGCATIREAPTPRSDVALCEALIPQALRDRMRHGLTVTAERPPFPPGIICILTAVGIETSDPDLTRAKASYFCAPGMASAEKLAEQRANASGTPVEGLGRLALRSFALELTFWDSEADCQVDAYWPFDTEQVLPFAKEVERALTSSLGEEVARATAARKTPRP